MFIVDSMRSPAIVFSMVLSVTPDRPGKNRKYRKKLPHYPSMLKVKVNQLHHRLSRLHDARAEIQVFVGTGRDLSLLEFPSLNLHQRVDRDNSFPSRHHDERIDIQAGELITEALRQSGDAHNRPA